MEPPPVRVVLVGAGGHASDVLATLEAVRAQRPDALEVVGAVDDDTGLDRARLAARGLRLLGTTADLADVGATHLVMALGWPWHRAEVAARLLDGPQGGPLPPTPGLADPRADVHPSVRLDPGSLVLGRAWVSPHVEIGGHAVVAHQAVLGHDTVVGPFAGVMPAAVLSGRCHIGARAMVGTNATVLEGRRIGDDARVGAGAVVVDDVPDGATVVGVPARPVG